MNIHLLNERIDSIIDFLYERQEPGGEFRMLRSFRGSVGEYVQPTEYAGWYHFGPCTFSTATIVYHLHGISNPRVEEMCRKGCEFLARSLENGVVRYVPAYAKPIDIPADVDCTGVALAALRRNGYPVRGNVNMILANTDGRGNFYTWLIPRRKHLRYPINFYWLVHDWWTCHRRMKSYGTEVERLRCLDKEYRESCEPTVGANVLLCLGVRGQTEKHLNTLIRGLEQDDVPLQYYQTFLALYFHTARLYEAGGQQIEVLKNKILSYIAGQQKPGGEVEDPLHTAMAALTLIYFGCWDSHSLDKAMHYLAVQEMHEQGWRPFSYCNDRHGIFDDGSAELTATFYLDAMFRYRQSLADCDSTDCSSRRFRNL